VEDTVTAIVTYRCNNRKPLVATTNLPDPDAGSVIIQRSGLDKPEYRRTLAEHIGTRARSRLFEMCTVVRIHHTEDYRVRKARAF
jgi:DNA replication protein DnaC